MNRRDFLTATASAAAAAAATNAPAAPATGETAQAPSPGSAADPLGVRADFPVTRERTYLNSAYITPVPTPVARAGCAFAESKAVRPILLGDMLKKADEVRAQYARLINADAEEVGFLFATSEGENVVANGLDLKAGDNVVIDELHYETEFVLYRQLQESRGIELRVAKHRDGRVEARDIEPLVDRRTRLVSVAWVSHQNGFRHDMRAIADVAHASGALFYADAIQAVGMFPVDVKAAGIDAMCSGTYKWLLAGFGVAPFYVRRDLLDRLRLDRYGWHQIVRERDDGGFDLHRTAKRFEYATLPFAEVYQLGAGLAYLERTGVSRIEAHTVGLALELAAGLARQGYRLFTPEGNRSSVVTFFTSRDAAAVQSAFANASIDVTVRAAVGQVRVSPALFNTADEIARFLEVTRTLA